MEQEMSSSIEVSLSSSSHVGPSSRHSKSLTVPSLSFSVSNPTSLKRKKSSEAINTITGVATLEDSHSNGVIDHGNTSTTPHTLLSQRKPRVKLDLRLEREPMLRETNRRSSSITRPDAGSSRKEHSSDHAITTHGRRDKGKATDRSAHPSSTRRSLPESNEQADNERTSYSGPLAQAEFERMRKEIEVWKKAAADNKKQAKKQAKKIEELKAQISAEAQAKKEQEMQLQNWKTKAEKREELITSIESSLQCQICIDILNKPYVLSPCGHMLCLLCLQEWFRKAPPGVEDDDLDPDEIENDPNYILNRRKTCPCCRAVIKQRPIPVFLVKSIAATLSQHKAAAEPGNLLAPRRSPSPVEDDPWKGLFFSSDDDTGDDFQETSDEDEEYQDAVGWAMHGLQMGELRQQILRAFDDDESESGSDFEVDDVHTGLVEEDDADVDIDNDSVNSYGSSGYENVYVPARWEPPTVDIDPEPYVLRNQGISASLLPMLRRGCTVDMIRLFAITYSHAKGLVAHLPSLDEDFTELSHLVLERNNRVFLGWNVHPDGEDYTGELYMRRLLAEMRNNPEQWTWTERVHSPGAFDVKLLVRVEDLELYDTTDTEDWLADDPYP